MMEPKANFWIEIDGEVVLSAWRVRLLEAVAETGSISAAAERMGISYRRAWDKIHESEERLGVKLVDTQTGGVGGGGSRLTPEAQAYISRFHEFADGLNELVAQRFREHFLT
ncbi:MAG: LysR family transcriptional regulator [Chloroflexi bacterium]|nr:MAG: LysR family transcriptional regulator [Chloroflexota bacterium]